MIINCKDYFYTRIEEMSKNDYSGEFHIIQINDNPDSNTYVRNKIKDCEKIGLTVVLHKFYPNDLPSVENLSELIYDLNNSKEVIAIMIQLPIPKEFYCLLDKISPDKDVDNLNKCSGSNRKFYSCTPKGIIDFLKRNGVELNGKDVTIVGRSDIVGKPLAEMMTQENATVTLCHSHTKDLKKHTKNADIVVCAIGKGKFFTKDYFSPNQLVIDVGINFINGKMYGDVNAEDADQIEGIKITSVPGGVGLLTRLALLENCTCIENQSKVKEYHYLLNSRRM